MPKGADAIPALHLTTLNALVSKVPPAPNLLFSGMFPAINYPSDQIEWEIEYGSGGMTPFVAPGAQAPTVGLDGIGKGSAAAAFWKEKTYLDEVILNNLRLPGTHETKMTAQRQIAKQAVKLTRRNQRRREWMVAKMLTEGAITYQSKGGLRFSVDYAIPTQNKITLAGNYVWGTGSSRNPVKDIFEVKELIADNYGYTVSDVFLNTATLKLLLFDANIQDLLKKSTFGDGDLFANPARVLAELLGIGTLTLYDEVFEVQAYPTAAVTGGSTTVVSVDDATDFEVGGKLRFKNLATPDSYEEKTITAVSKTANTVTVSAAPTSSYAVGSSQVTMKKKFVADNKVLMFSRTIDGDSIAEFLQAPFGLSGRFGRFADTKDEWDPEGVWLRVQDKGLPVLKHPEAVVSLTVA